MSQWIAYIHSRETEKVENQAHIVNSVMQAYTEFWFQVFKGLGLAK